MRLLAATAIAALTSSGVASRPGSAEAGAGKPRNAFLAPAPITLAEDPPPPPMARAAWAEALQTLHFHNINSDRRGAFRLYAADGTFDEAVANELDVVLAPRDAAPRPMNRRLYRLLVKIANHFHADAIEVVSTFRDTARQGSRHRSGEAIDLILVGTKPAALAAELRGYARVGVGIYTHRRTQFVHLDVREESYHWLDASPPGRVWRELRLPDRSAQARDAAYLPGQDLP